MKFMSKKMIFASLLALSLIGNSINAVNKLNSEQISDCCKLLILLGKSKGLVEKATSKENNDIIKNLSRDQRIYFFKILAQDCVQDSNKTTPWFIYVDLLVLVLKGDKEFDSIIKILEKSRDYTDDSSIAISFKKVFDQIKNPRLKKNIKKVLPDDITSVLKILEIRAKLNNKPEVNKTLCEMRSRLAARFK